MSDKDTDEGIRGILNIIRESVESESVQDVIDWINEDPLTRLAAVNTLVSVLAGLYPGMATLFQKQFKQGTEFFHGRKH